MTTFESLTLSSPHSRLLSGMALGAVLIIAGIMFATFALPGALTKTNTVTLTTTVTTTQWPPVLGTNWPIVTDKGLSSESIKLGSFIGRQPVLVEFMASWCGHCQNMAPILDDLHSKYGGSVQFISVAATWRGANATTTADFIKKYPSPWPYILDNRNEVFDYFGVNGTPTFLVFNSKGELVQRIVGEVPLQTLASVLEKAL